MSDGTPKAIANNPVENALAHGVTAAGVIKAVTHSGYPLQVDVADMLRSKFDVHEEWAYKDSESQQIRTVDLLAAYKPDCTSRRRVRPNVTLLVECKQSEMPFVFFGSDSSARWVPEFPLLSGLKGGRQKLTIVSNGTQSSWRVNIQKALELDTHQLFKAPIVCTTLSKCARRSGGELELTGSDAYNNIVLPLSKAMSDFRRRQEPPATFVYFDFSALLGLAVLDAPMVYVNARRELVLAPWIRLIRHDVDENAHLFDRDKFLVIDFIHRNYLAKHIESVVVPFADEFAARAVRHHAVIADGVAYVKGMMDDSTTELRSRLRTTKRDVTNLKGHNRYI